MSVLQSWSFDDAREGVVELVVELDGCLAEVVDAHDDPRAIPDA